jgi:hypothetical protein
MCREISATGITELGGENPLRKQGPSALLIDDGQITGVELAGGEQPAQPAMSCFAVGHSARGHLPMGS